MLFISPAVPPSSVPPLLLRLVAYSVHISSISTRSSYFAPELLSVYTLRVILVVFTRSPFPPFVTHVETGEPKDLEA